MQAINDSVLQCYRTRLCGGFPEPFYQAPGSGLDWAEIRYTRDFERSALHELAHWCVAGVQRRQQDDYGYWYAPDGRDAAQQQQFFRVEVRPQAIEQHFCDALGLAFDVSIDNLGNPALAGIDEFRHAVAQCYTGYAQQGLPPRATAIVTVLKQWAELQRSG